MRKTTKSAIGGEVKQLTEIMSLLFDEIYSAFMKHRFSLKYQQVSVDINKRLRNILSGFYTKTSDTTHEEALFIQATALHYSKLYYNLLRISGQVETKVKENVLFSKMATDEMNELFRRTRELLPHVGDAMLTGNIVIVRHVQNEINYITKLAIKNAGMHEDRLCKGVCHPKASGIYTQLLYNLEDILWHYKALAGKHSLLPKE